MPTQRTTTASPSSRSQAFAAIVGGGGLAFFLASSFSNGSNFIFHVVMSRLLGPANYGALGSLLGLITVVTFAIAALQAAVTQAVAGRVSEQRVAMAPLALRKHMSRMLLAAGAVFCLIAALSPTIEDYLHLVSPIPVILLAMFVSLSLLGLVPQGVLLGELSFKVVAVALATGAMIRLFIGILLVDLGFGLDGALAGSVVASLVMLGILSWPIRQHLLSKHGEKVPITLTAAVLAVAALGGFSALVGVDTFLARHYLTAADSGHYAAAATAARIALFLPGAVALIAFPKLATVRGTGARAREVLANSLLVVGLLGTCASLVMLAAPHLVISILFGSNYEAAAQPLRILSIASAGLGIINILVYFHLARESKRALVGWIGVALAVGCIAIWHRSLTEIAWTMLGVVGLTVASAVLGVFGKLVESSGEVEPRLRDNAFGSELDLSIIVPYFNPGTRVRTTTEQLVEVLSDLRISFEVIAVSDGSTDGSDESMTGFVDNRIRQHRLPINRGKGEALRAGFAMARGDYLGFIDADGDISPTILRSFVDLIQHDRPDVVLGSKRHPDSRVAYPALRRLYSWLYQQLVRVLFRLSVQDTQTGIKLIRRDVVADVLPRMLEKRFVFDLELLVVAKQRGFEHLAELPVTINKQFPSTISMRAAIQMLMDTLATFYRLRILQHYGPRCLSPVVEIRQQSSLVEYEGQAERAPGVIGQTIRSAERPRRILFYNWKDITHPTAGGSEVYAHEICKEWATLGHRVTFFTSTSPGRPENEWIDGIRIVRRGTKFSVYREARRFYINETDQSFDLVVDAVNTRPFGCPAFVNEASLVTLVHQVARDVWKFEANLPLSIVGRHIVEPLWLRRYRSARVVAVSDSTRNALLGHYRFRHVTVIPEGVRDLEDPISDIEREDRPTVAFCGRLTPSKRPDEALKAFEILHERVPDSQMWVIGSGPLEEKLRRSRRPGVRFFGRVSESVKRERLARAHAVVATSVREGWGLVVTEAAALGTPTIAYDVPGLRDSVAASGGVLVPPNSRDLGEALANLIPNWMARGMPSVSPGGVVPWSEVATRVLEVAGLSDSGLVEHESART